MSENENECPFLKVQAQWIPTQAFYCTIFRECTIILCDVWKVGWLLCIDWYGCCFYGVFLKVIVFYEKGEPTINGESNDLKVRYLIRIFL